MLSLNENRKRKWTSLKNTFAVFILNDIIYMFAEEHVRMRGHEDMCT